MSFTTDIKKEIIACGYPDVSEKKAGLAAFVHTSGELGYNDKTPSFFIVSETENVTEFFMNAFFEVFGYPLSITHASKDKMSGRAKLLLQCPLYKTEEVMKGLDVLKKTGEIREGIALSKLKTDSAKIAYIQGAFLGSGSCTIPNETGKTGYHLEFVFSNKETAKDFCSLLLDFELFAKWMERKEKFVVYIKSRDIISDFLSVIGASKCLRRFMEFLEKREEANYDNRTKNCTQGNAEKKVKAAEKQIRAIQKLMDGKNTEILNDELKTLADARIQHKEMSLQELANYLSISKSCLNHRLRRLIELSKQTEEK